MSDEIIRNTLQEGAARANAAYRQRRISIDPITRLEGHGKIDIFLNDEGKVDRAYLQVPELRGFEKFMQGRLVEDAPQITSRICGVCPMAHHMAATKALDDVFKVEPTPAAKKIRELVYNIFMAEDHALHFYFLGGPDFIVGPEAPAAERNVLGVIAKVGVDIGRRVIAMRRELRELVTLTGGKIIHPVMGLPGGVAKRITEDDRKRFKKTTAEAVEFAQFSLKLFDDVVLKNADYVKLITSDAFTHETYYMGMVDDNNRANFYDGMIRVVDPSGKEKTKFKARDYLKIVAEQVEPWSYTKFCYLKDVGWRGFKDGVDSGIYCVAPMARLNVTEGMATPLASAALEKYYEVLGRPVHHTLANHWARLIELLYATERAAELADDPEITSKDIRNIPTRTPSEGMGVVEAPRGTLFHHYKTDDRGVIEKANLIVATQNNSARIAMSVEKAAKGLISDKNVSEGVLNQVEMAFRAYDPCHACATHSLPGSMPLVLRVRDLKGETQAVLWRDGDGNLRRE